MPRTDSVPATQVGAGPSNWLLLLSPREIRGRRIRNRIVSTPHATGWGQAGLIAPTEVAYHVRKAAGGCGLIMTFGSASVDPDSAASYGSVSLWDPGNAGWTVQIITDLPFVAAKVDPTQVWFVRRRLKKAGVTLRGNSELRHDPGRWALVDTESDDISPVPAPDLIVYADLRSARDDLSRALAETLPQVPVRRVGDALAPRGLLDAITEGARAGVSAS